MAEIVNLRRARKERARRQHENEAQANRLRFGRTKADKAADRDRDLRERQALEDKHLDPKKPDKP
jgi:hypothetical protein